MDKYGNFSWGAHLVLIVPMMLVGLAFVYPLVLAVALALVPLAFVPKRQALVLLLVLVIPPALMFGVLKLALQ